MPVAATEIGSKGKVIHRDWVAVDWLLMAVTAFMVQITVLAVEVVQPDPVAVR